ncbi:hypothetical protein FGK60_31355 [Streptomyces sp. DASNCL29]|nr:hypothetical protein FGK60_31355 [Streptomyces sp. DASNCL29]
MRSGTATGCPTDRDACGGPRGGAAYRGFPLPPSHNWGSAPWPRSSIAGGAGKRGSAPDPAPQSPEGLDGQTPEGLEGGALPHGPGVQGRSPWVGAGSWAAGTKGTHTALIALGGTL